MIQSLLLQYCCKLMNEQVTFIYFYSKHIMLDNKACRKEYFKIQKAVLFKGKWFFSFNTTMFECVKPNKREFTVCFLQGMFLI